MQNYNVTATSEASPAVIWRLLLDARSWPVWSAVDSLDTERCTGLDPEGRDAIGAVRAFRTGWMVTGERLTGLDEEKQLTYEDAFNPVMRNYRRSSNSRLRPTGARSSAGTAPIPPLGDGLADAALHAALHATDG